MRRPDRLAPVPPFLRSSFARWLSLCTIGGVLTVSAAPPAVAAPPTSATPPAVATPPEPAPFEGLLAEGDLLVTEGHPDQGAEMLAAAYHQMPPELRVGAPGRRAVVSACNAYEAAWQATADTRQLEANQALLTTYLDELEAARAAGQPTAPVDEQEQGLRGRSAGIAAKLAEPQTAPSAPPPAEPTPVLAADPIEAQPEITFPPPDPRLRRNALILVSAGAAGAVAGAIMVIAGATKATRAEDQRTRMPADAANDARSDKMAGTIVATMGALVFSGSVMLLGVGTNRLSVLRRELALSLRPTLGGVVLRGRF
jgi:hypothetical protein